MPEKQHFTQERKTASLEKAAGERLSELEHTLETHETKTNHKELERARVEAHAEAIFAKEYSTEKKQHHDNEIGHVATKQERDNSYKKTLKHLQSELNAPERTFSKVIHNKIIERVSDTIGSTVARPNAILFGSLSAFLGVLAVYFYARHIGFALSGFETIAAFTIGWVVGIVIDIIRVAFRKAA